MQHKFNQDSFDKYDELCRTWAKQLFTRYGVVLKNNNDKYGIDLVAYRNNKIVGYVEVDIKLSWIDLFMYRHLNVPVRKRKLLTSPLRSVLVTFNNNGSQCFICNDNIVLNSEIEEVKNKNVPNGEMFFKVPVSLIKLVTV